MSAYESPTPLTRLKSRMVPMRRIFSVASLSVLLVTLHPVFAQRAPGGHASASHSFGGSFSGSFARPSGFSPRSFTTAPRTTSTAPARAFSSAYRLPYGSPSASQAARNRNGARYRSPYRGYPVYGGYPYANSWEVLPWDLGYPDFTGYNNSDSGSDPAQQSAASVAPSDDGYRPDYGEPAYQNSAVISSPSIEQEPQLTLIFNDGHQQAIRNYVLTSDTVIVLDRAASGYQQRVPLTALNLPATQQGAQQAGLDFSPPA
jgi:hypothetical protein